MRCNFNREDKSGDEKSDDDGDDDEDDDSRPLTQEELRLKMKKKLVSTRDTVSANKSRFPPVPAPTKAEVGLYLAVFFSTVVLG